MCTDQVIGYFLQSGNMQDKNLWLLIACAILKMVSVVGKNWQIKKNVNKLFYIF